MRSRRWWRLEISVDEGMVCGRGQLPDGRRHLGRTCASIAGDEPTAEVLWDAKKGEWLLVGHAARVQQPSRVMLL